MIEIGDRVRFLDFDGEGTVVSVSGGSTLVVDVDGMRIPAALSEVAKVEVNNIDEERALYEDASKSSVHYREKSNAEIRKKTAQLQASGKRKGHKNSVNSGLLEVDLHFNTIRASYPAAKNIPESECLEVQLEVFERRLDEAIRKGYTRVVFIHGVGSGVLRNELLRRLSRHRDVKYAPASAFKYGDGAIEVTVTATAPDRR